MKVAIYTLGCKVNTYESEYVKNLFEKRGYVVSNFDDICDIYVINTCTVTNNSDSKSRKIIHQAFRRNPKACIVVMGCFVVSHADSFMDYSIAIGNKDKSKIVDLVEEWYQKKQSINHIIPTDNLFEDMDIANFSERTRAFVKIQDGCENFCSYCIIPYVRGKCRSKDHDKVIDEIKSLIKNGYQEIVLTGIHTGHYGVDIGISFAGLLKNIVQIEGLKRLRISSIEITELTEDVLTVINDNAVIVDHLHIPLQSGSEKILKLMKRKYNKDYFDQKIAEIRRIRPNISITTDVIVGFPGETNEDFQEMIAFIKKINFTKLHVFPYSKRDGTVAATLPLQISETIKKERVHRLLQLSKELELDYYQKFLHKYKRVLIEKNNFGHTDNYLPVCVIDSCQSNTFVDVEIIGVDFPYCQAKLTK